MNRKNDWLGCSPSHVVFPLRGYCKKGFLCPSNNSTRHQESNQSGWGSWSGIAKLAYLEYQRILNVDWNRMAV
jgi:hypothetical protein